MLPEPWDTLFELFNLFCTAFGFYHFGVAVQMSRGTKEIRQLREERDEHMRQLERRVDFQLRAKGCEGLGLNEEERSSR